jgi:hypothetical protein
LFDKKKQAELTLPSSMVDNMNRKLRTSTRSIFLSYDIDVSLAWGDFTAVTHLCHTEILEQEIPKLGMRRVQEKLKASRCNLERRATAEILISKSFKGRMTRTGSHPSIHFALGGRAPQGKVSWGADLSPKTPYNGE